MEIIKYILPSIVVLFAAIIILQQVLKYHLKLWKKENEKGNKEKALMLRLQAYERMILFLERISPQEIVFRLPAESLDVQRYRRMLLQNIREEFEHNIAQQIYLSDKSWEMVAAAKESVMLLVNKAGSQLQPGAPAAELAAGIVELKMREGVPQLDNAIAGLKKEVRTLFFDEE